MQRDRGDGDAQKQGLIPLDIAARDLNQKQADALPALLEVIQGNPGIVAHVEGRQTLQQGAPVRV